MTTGRDAEVGGGFSRSRRGVALVNAQKALDKVGDTADEKHGVAIVRRALRGG